MSLNNRDLIPNDVVRAAYLRSGMRISDFARFMGLIRQQPDTSSAKRMLGLAPDYGPSVRNGKAYREFITYPNALKVCHVLGLDPVDLGL